MFYFKIRVWPQYLLIISKESENTNGYTWMKHAYLLSTQVYYVCVD